ncbi:Periplasmic thiol disulfide interchange protein DsbA [Enhygromyxa salina]|uniref:Periplasmic thiol disulfide interchange protein DsbA n=1 Tax=Enhygromyxa salina TaxID=215803 RepID=A0A0C1ZVB7_9BACT|nr:DsbA family protein [Enhygromyxa salina]KIG15008.1 Periplasmic thiol disulfide interchange protein DsbA [Enhygromyxa salina]
MGPLVACPAKPDQQQAAVDIDLRRFVVQTGEDDYAIGGDQPLVTIVVWSDYACAPCGRSWQVMKHLVEDYGEDLRVVYRAGTVPGFAHGERAAEAAFAAGGQGKFWDMHWRLFSYPDDFSRPILRKHAEAIGLDVPQFMDDLDTGRYASPRVRDRRQAAALGLSPLPAAFANGLFVLGFKDEAGWHALIDREIASARKMMQDGIKRADIYEEFMRTAKRGRVDDNDEAKRLQGERNAAAEAADPAQLAGPSVKARYAVPTGAAGFGPADAPVVVVEFVDYQCPYCRKAHNEVLPALREQYPDDVRVEIRHLPLEIHPAAAAAARAAITAGEQGKFGEFHARLFAEDIGGLGFSTFVEEAEKLGLDIERFKRDFQTREVGDKLASDVLLARRLGIQGTPGFFVNGRYIDGARSAATYTEMVDEELARAKQLEAGGTPRAKLHAALMQGALTPDQFPNAQLAVAAHEATPNPEPNPDQEPVPRPAPATDAGQP